MKSKLPFSAIIFFIAVSLIPLYSQNAIITQLVEEVDIENLRHQIYVLTGAEFIDIEGYGSQITSRHRDNPGNELAFQYMAREAANMGYDTLHHAYSENGKNLIAIKPGATFPNQYYMVCAHYDTRPEGDISPGADDNGSGTAALLELMRVFQNTQFEYSLIFAFWDEEEYGLLGSKAYAGDENWRPDSLLWVLNLDGISHDSDDDHRALLHVSPDLPETIEYFDALAAINETYEVGLDLRIRNPGGRNTDHAPFWDEGISAVWLIQDWDDDSNPGYHSVNDDTTGINWPFYEKMVRLVTAGIAEQGEPLPATFVLKRKSHLRIPYIGAQQHKDVLGRSISKSRGLGFISIGSH